MRTRVGKWKIDAGTNPLRDLALIARFHRHFNALAPDIVLGFTIKNNIYGAFAAKRLGIPFVPNITGLGTAFLSSSLLEGLSKALYRGAFRKLGHVVFQNRDDLALFEQARLIGPATRTVVMPGSGIDTKRFAPAPYPDLEERGAVVFLLVARLLRDKGIAEYAEAARALKADHPAARFQLLGGSDFTNSSSLPRETAERWHEEGLVEYLGTSGDVRPVVAQAHCIVLPSYREGAPRTLIEGAAIGRPLIATDVPGCREVVREGENGFLCPPRSSEGLADAMRRFLALSHEERAAMGLNSRALAESEFSAERVVEAYRRILEETAIEGSHG